MKQKLLKLMCLLCVSVISASAWGDSTVLFHETFGNNTGSARSWSDEYSVKSGVASVYSGITGYTVTNVKQGKNTTGSSQSGLNQSTQGTDAVLIIGPLNVESYNTLSLTYQWKATSIKGTYTTSAYYATSSTGEYTEITGTGTGATSFVTRSYSLPEAAQVSTLYLKIVWNTSNAQAIIDEVNLTGIETITGPAINITTPAKLAHDATSGSISYSLINPVDGGVVTAESSESWLTIGAVSESSVAFTCEKNTAETDRTATVTFTYTYNTSETVTKDVTVTQGRFVIDFATLPFSWDEKATSTTGVTSSGVSTYKSSPYLKFDDTSDYLVLKLTEQPYTLSFDIKGNDFSGGTFKVQTSTDGSSYTDLDSFTELGETESVEYNNIPAGTRYIKWVYTTKSSGNVALGNINVKNTYTRTTAAGNWGTICLPYAATVTGAKLYRIIGKEITGSEVTAILLDEVASIEAGKPYIFKATADDVVATYTGTTYTAASAVNGLYGTYSAIAAGGWGTYVSGDLYLLTTTNVQAADKTSSSLAANRAYIVLDEVNNIGSPVKGVRLGFDEATAITELTEKTEATEGVIYNLQGQQLSAPQRGLNIIGGKKILVK